MLKRIEPYRISSASCRANVGEMKMKNEINIQQEIYNTAFCVIGLSLMMVSIYIVTDRCDLSVVLGSIVGSTASILNYALNVMTVQIAVKYDPQKAASIILMSKILRTFLMGFIAYLILLFPILHIGTGLTAMFFPQVSRLIQSKIKS